MTIDGPLVMVNHYLRMSIEVVDKWKPHSTSHLACHFFFRGEGRSLCKGSIILQHITLPYLIEPQIHIPRLLMCLSIVASGCFLGLTAGLTIEWRKRRIFPISGFQSVGSMQHSLLKRGGFLARDDDNKGCLLHLYSNPAMN